MRYFRKKIIEKNTVITPTNCALIKNKRRIFFLKIFFFYYLFQVNLNINSAPFKKYSF